jgi:hypothetical protein
MTQKPLSNEETPISRGYRQSYVCRCRNSPRHFLCRIGTLTVPRKPWPGYTGRPPNESSATSPALKTHALTYGNEHHNLIGFTDADGASQEHRHAISGFAFLFDGGAVSWGSRKQELVTLSTAEAEYVAATHAAKECIWLRRLITSLFGPTPIPTTLYCDNQAALTLATEDNYHARTKHIDMRFHFIRQTISDGHIKLIYCPTEDMTADILTKALPKYKVAIHSQTLGICRP